MGAAKGVPGAVEVYELPDGRDAVCGVIPFRMSCMVKSFVTF